MNNKYIEMHLYNGRKSPSNNSTVINKEGPVIENIHSFAVDSSMYLLSMCDLVSLNRIELVAGWNTYRFKNTRLRFPVIPFAYGDVVHEFIGIGYGNKNCFYSDFTLQPNKPEFQLRLALNKQIIPNHLVEDHIVIENITKVKSNLGCLSIYFNSPDAYNKAKELTNWFDTDLGRGLDVPYALDSSKILRFNSSVCSHNKHQLHEYGSYYRLEDMYALIADIFSCVTVNLM